jgi:Zn-dependent protease
MRFAISPITLVARLIVLLVIMPIHEWAHAWSAYQLGDDTASLQGRLTLNPMAHLDLFGGILILLTGFGWARPVPVNPYRMRVAPRPGMALSALAGPVSNFLTAMVCAVPFRLGLFSGADIDGSFVDLATLLWFIAQVSLGLGLFNLLPFYPLDGEKVLVGVLPREWGDRLLSIRPFSPYILMALIALGVANLLVGLLWSPLMRLLFWL